MDIQRSDRTSSDLGRDGAPAAASPGMQTDAEQRATATARYRAFAEGAAPPQSEPAWSAEHACGGLVDHTVLFHQETGDVNEVVSNDVAQGDLPDCALMATLCTVASSAEGRALIHSAVVENKDEQGRTTSYTVTLYRPAPTSSGAPQTYSPVQIDVDPAICAKYAMPRAEGGTNEVWPQAIEKAFSIYMGGAGKTNVRAYQVMEILTGRQATLESIKGLLFGDYGGQELESDVQAGKLIVLASKHDLPYPWVVGHAYAVVGVETHNGVRCAILHNPWNVAEREPLPVPLDQLRRYFDFASVGSLR